jgi:cytochrome P450
VRFALRDQEIAQEPGNYYAELRDKCPVAHSEDYEGFWILSRYDDVVAAARNTEIFSSADGVTIPRLPIPPQICLEQDEPDHALYRRPIQSWLSPRRMAQLEPAIREIVNRLIDQFIDGGEADLAAELAEPVPPMVMAMLLGLPETDWPVFRDQMSRCIGASASENVEDAVAASVEMVAYLSRKVAERRADPADDMMSDIATLEVAGELLTDEQAVSMAFLLLGAGHETTVGAIGGAIYYLAREPELQDRIRADPRLVLGAAEEALRLVAPLPGMGRTVRSDIEVDGTTIPSGERVMLMYGSANRDPQIFDDPEQFQPERSNNRHVAFGSGIHRCVGAPLARLELRVVIEELLRRTSHFSLVPGEAAQARYGTSRGYRHIKVRWSSTGE